MRGSTAAAVMSTIALASCGGEDPTSPRGVREREPVELRGAPDVPQSDSTPSKGLPCDAQEGVVRACGAATDNYKASFNEDPTVPERRTWLAIHELEVDGNRYSLAKRHPLVVDEVVLERDDGGRATVRVRSDGPEPVTLRVGPQEGLWGPLLTLGEAPIPAGDDVAVDLVVTVDGDVHVLALRYRRDESLATADDDSLEHRGPGGRWLVSGQQTATNLELGWE